jgi:hypothetical protein
VKNALAFAFCPFGFWLLAFGYWLLKLGGRNLVGFSLVLGFQLR